MRSPFSLLLLLVFFGVAVALWCVSLQRENADKRQPMPRASSVNETASGAIEPANVGPAPPFTGDAPSEIPGTEQLLQKQVESLQVQLELLRKENAELRDQLQKQGPLPKPTLAPPGANRNNPPELLSP